jgi:flagellar FliL protein
MAEEDTEVEGKKKSPIVKIILIAVVAIVLLAGTVVGTLFVTGFFDKKDEAAAEAQLKALEEQAANASNPASGAEPKKVTKSSPELTRFENHYMELEKDMLANLTNSRKVIQVQLAIMTHYDQRVFKNVEKHQFALRSAALDVMRQTTEDQLGQADFRKNLAEKIRTEMNAVLERFEDFGGIEEVYFTSFVVQ